MLDIISQHADMPQYLNPENMGEVGAVQAQAPLM